mmetsp:Transcript_23516/g.53656  ORF Transcript_23516/g.53656 Transcript_23516/m.53656 type:complete len:86 (-) Transcript_23516:744-1001(-)
MKKNDIVEATNYVDQNKEEVKIKLLNNTSHLQCKIIRVLLFKNYFTCCGINNCNPPRLSENTCFQGNFSWLKFFSVFDRNINHTL